MISAFTAATGRHLRGFVADQGGVSAVEFAMLLPLMIMLYLGSVEITQAVSADRKMTLVASTIGDLVARTDNSCITQTAINETFDAGFAVLAPFNNARMKMVITHIVIDKNKQATVVSNTGGWSQARNGGATRSGDLTSVIPEPLRATEGAVIWAEAEYTYIPTVGKVIAKDGISLKEKVFLRPRMNKTLPLC